MHSGGAGVLKMKLMTAICLVGAVAILLGAWRHWSRDPLEGWVRALAHDKDPVVRNKAIDEIVLNWSRLEPEVAVPLLIGAIRDPNPQVRMGALLLVPAYGDRANAAIPRVVEAIDDPHVSVRIAAIDTLGDWIRGADRKDRRIIAALAAAMHDEKPFVRNFAGKMLSRAGLGAMVPSGVGPR